jgi:hypothetical protein
VQSEVDNPLVAVYSVVADDTGDSELDTAVLAVHHALVLDNRLEPGWLGDKVSVGQQEGGDSLKEDGLVQGAQEVDDDGTTLLASGTVNPAPARVVLAVLVVVEVVEELDVEDRALRVLEVGSLTAGVLGASSREVLLLKVVDNLTVEYAGQDVLAVDE